jgi:nucleoside 2-deoxyribosyltransferase
MKNCFVLMPLIDDFRAIYEAIALELKDAFGPLCQCAKADDDRRPGMVTEKIVHFLLNTDLVIAVVADPRTANSMNPNVMYELGIAHSFRKPTLVVADNTTGLPFDLRAVETIQLDFSRFADEKQRTAFLADLRKALRLSLRTPDVVDYMERKRIPRNPITTQLSGTRIFIEDLPWLWGYCEVLKRESEAHTVWEITRDLFWPGESLFFESLRAAIRDGRKHYFMVPDDEGVLRKAEAIKKQLQLSLPANELENLLRFVAIETKYFVLWPIAIVLYDADYATGSGGIICEPMTSEVGHDSWDDEIRNAFLQHSRSEDLGSFQQYVAGLDWTQRRRESTFDIRLDGRVVDSLATSFARIWNEKIREEARQKTNEQEQSALLDTWLIRG